MTVELHVGNTKCHILHLTDLSVIDPISQALSYELGSAKFSWQFKQGMWSGKTNLLTKNLYFPSGCLTTVVNILKIKSVPYKIIDNRTYYNYNKRLTEWQGFDLYDYQKRVVDLALTKKNGMVKVATGGGKSAIIANLLFNLNLKCVVYVVSLDLLTQMKETLEESLNIPIGIVGAGQCQIEDITVCSAWTAGKIYSKSKEKEIKQEDVEEDKWSPSYYQKDEIKDMIESSQVIILDEAQFAAASSIRSILSNSKNAAYRYGFSGTPWRSDGDDILLEAAFGDTICDINASQLINEGYLVQPKILFKDIIQSKKRINKTWPEVKSKYIVENEFRNDLLISSTVELLDAGRKPLILFREHKHGEILRDMLPSDIRYRYVTGLISKDERDDIRDEFKRGEIDLILASTVYDQGVDLPTLDALVLAGGGKSTAKALQRIGRVIRKAGESKKDALVVETFDQSHYVKKHSIARYSIYKTEPMFKIKFGKAMSKSLGRVR